MILSTSWSSTSGYLPQDPRELAATDIRAQTNRVNLIYEFYGGKTSKLSILLDTITLTIKRRKSHDVLLGEREGDRSWKLGWWA